MGREPLGRGDMGYEVAFASWLCVSLLAMTLGGGLHKYAQAWARNASHPGTAAGVSVVVLGIALALTAASLYLATGAEPLTSQRPSHLLFALGVSLVLVLAWAVLAIVFFAGWQVPPVRLD